MEKPFHSDEKPISDMSKHDTEVSEDDTSNDETSNNEASDEETPEPTVIETSSEVAADSKSFPQLGVCSWLISQLSCLGITNPSPVQAACIPPILSGRDCVGVAKTGEGKTLAFALPILQTLSVDPYGIFALVLTPTRELANQIGDTFRSVGKPMGLREVVVTGGRDTVRQSQDLDRRPHVVIATPGRLADHIENNSTFSLSKVKYLVLDEADRLLEGEWSLFVNCSKEKFFLSTLVRKPDTMLEYYKIDFQLEKHCVLSAESCLKQLIKMVVVFLECTVYHINKLNLIFFPRWI